MPRKPLPLPSLLFEANLAETHKEEPGRERGKVEHDGRKVGFQEMDVIDLSQKSFESFVKGDLD